MHHPYEIGCCLLRSAEQVLSDAGIRVPATTGVIDHVPVLACGCDALFVRRLSARNSTRDRYAAADLGGLSGACDVLSYTSEWEIHITRCVTIDNPLDHGCSDSGSCDDVLSCDGPGPGVPVVDDCVPGGVDKATETWWLLNDAFQLESRVAALWARCLCEGWCQVGCEESPGRCGVSASWVATRPYDSGGCGGSIIEMSLTFP